MRAGEAKRGQGRQGEVSERGDFEQVRAGEK